jgi:type I restriction enzyme M protein
MLDTDTKRRIDTARDILVGKVPDPKSQVEQITIALIYKFMDDMDAESEEFGGKRKFFAKEFARYGWAKLMRSGLGGHETLNLYAEAITSMPENPGIPPLFRDIFKNAYLPYRDPETLKMFLKVIDEFTYDHSEKLGDAFEYLLSVLGSQGDAGQFRTPRHIIDFIVEVIDPKKNETVLDPACGTAGFLISAYKHILKANYEKKGACTLTPDERGHLAQNFKGYDISPDMVRLSLVNMYLHGFADPHIFEYDTLTSQDRWNEYADVILANPPFMSPKGGIKPHNRFSVQSKRSEVLFVDYMAEHLTPNGRAGIIVPEGIIFQSQTAYKQLRKMLVEEYLVVVVSLPAGVFNPYSGVKTSILILDKSLAKKTDTIAFYKIENDGFGLGAQRREIDKNDLPAATEFLKSYLQSTSTSSILSTSSALIVPKEKIVTNGDYNLSGERYRENGTRSTKFFNVTLGEVIKGKPQYGSGASKVPFDGEVRYVRITDITDKGELKVDDPVSPSVIEPENFLSTGDLLIARSGSVGRAYLHKNLPGKFQYAGYLIRFCIDPAKALPSYVYRVVQSPAWWEWIASNSKTGTLTNINAQQYSSFKFPLPPLEVQKEMVAEIEGYQKVIDGARAILDNYRPHIFIHPDWPMVELCEVCDVRDGTHDSPKYILEGYPLITSKNLKNGFIDVTDVNLISREDLDAINKRSKVDAGDILMPMIGTIGNPVIADSSREYAVKNVALIKFYQESRIDNRYLKIVLSSADMQSRFELQSSGSTQRFIPLGFIRSLSIPLPPLDTQQAIVAEIEDEQGLVNANRELITRFEKKIQNTLARVWGEDTPSQGEV